MTRQIPDSLWYKGDKYTILYGPAEFGFNTLDYGLWGIGRHTANHRGYWCEYAITDGMLELKNLYINNRINHYPTVNGVRAEAPRPVKTNVTTLTDNGFETHMKEVLTNDGYHFYKDLRIQLEYTGKVTIGRDRVALSFSNIGYPPAWMFGTVLELVFENGKFEGRSDISESFVEERERQVELELNRFSDEYLEGFDELLKSLERGQRE